jgi:hypothetical protein
MDWKTLQYLYNTRQVHKDERVTYLADFDDSVCAGWSIERCGAEGFPSLGPD